MAKRVIDDFHGNYFFLSNFSESPVWHNGKLWPTVEHAFQAAKVDAETAQKIFEAKTPGEAKKLGRRGQMRPDWDDIRVRVMGECLTYKFLFNDDLLQKLLDTGDAELIEGNTWHDQFWGDCSCPKCAYKHGENMLGQLLMSLRDAYRDGRFIYAVKLYDKNGVGSIKHYFKNRNDAFKYLAGRKDGNGELCVADDRHIEIIHLK